MTDDNPVEPTAEQRLAAIGIPLEEIDFARNKESLVFEQSGM